MKVPCNNNYFNYPYINHWQSCHHCLDLQGFQVNINRNSFHLAASLIPMAILLSFQILYYLAKTFEWEFPSNLSMLKSKHLLQFHLSSICHFIYSLEECIPHIKETFEIGKRNFFLSNAFAEKASSSKSYWLLNLID